VPVIYGWMLPPLAKSLHIASASESTFAGVSRYRPATFWVSRVSPLSVCVNARCALGGRACGAGGAACTCRSDKLPLLAQTGHTDPEHPIGAVFVNDWPVWAGEHIVCSFDGTSCNVDGIDVTIISEHDRRTAAGLGRSSPRWASRQ